MTSKQTATILESQQKSILSSAIKTASQAKSVEKKLSSSDIHVDPAYEALVPRPTADEYAALKASIERDRQRDKIVVDDSGAVLDGCTRFKILKELKREIAFEVRYFPDKHAKESFVRETAALRRSLNAFQKVKLAGAELEVEQASAMMRQKSGKATIASSDAKVGKASEIVARKFGIPVATFERGLFVLKHASEDQKHDLENGKGTINGVYSQLSRKLKAEGPKDHTGSSPDSSSIKVIEDDEKGRDRAALDRKTTCDACGVQSTREDLKQVLLDKECRQKLGMKW